MDAREVEATIRPYLIGRLEAEIENRRRENAHLASELAEGQRQLAEFGHDLELQRFQEVRKRATDSEYCSPPCSPK